MKILVFGTQILGVEGTYTLENNNYKSQSGVFGKDYCQEITVNLPSDYVANKFSYVDGNFEKTDSYKAELLAHCLDQRAKEYPPMADYLDGIVKGNNAQVQAYIDACLAVKSKYPKP